MWYDAILEVIIVETKALLEIDGYLKRLSPDKLAVVLDFVAFLAARQDASSYEAMLQAESVLKRDWLKPEEDAAWADL